MSNHKNVCEKWHGHPARVFHGRPAHEQQQFTKPEPAPSKIEGTALRYMGKMPMPRKSGFSYTL